MGMFRECIVDVELNENIDTKEYLKMVEEINITNKEIFGSVYDMNNDEVYLTSYRGQNMEYQMNMLSDIFKKYKDVVVEANGSVMCETGDSFYFGDEE